MNKKVLSLLLTFVLVFTSLTFSTPITKSNANTVANTDEVYYGDVDGDGKISINDATKIRIYCNGTTSLTLDQKKRADVDFNGKITENDAKLIQEYLAHIITEFKRPLYGDANGDGIISVDDVSTIQQYLCEMISIKKENRPATDVDFDGTITIRDATEIQRYLVGGFDSFEGYTIRYDSNGGSGCMEYQNIGMFDTVNLSQNQFRKTGYSFTGWHIELDDNPIIDAYGNPRLFADESQVSELVAENKTTLTAKAQWKEVKFSGIYSITPRHAPYKCISIDGGSTANYANAQLYSNYNYTYQQFILCYAGIANCYYIYDTNSNKVLETASSDVTYGTNVRLNQYTGGANQIWYLESIGNDYYYICSYLNREYVFDIRNSSTCNGANLQMFRKVGYYRQQFKFDYINSIFDLSKAYRITPRSSSSACVDVKGAGTANGTNVQFYEYEDKPQQQYNFSLQSDGSYVIYSCLSDKVLTVKDDKAVNCANIALYTFENKASQKWFLQTAGNGYYYFASALNTGYVLDIYGGYTGSETNIGLFKRYGGYDQQFKLQQADFAQIDSGTFNLQVPNKRCINIKEYKEYISNNDNDDILIVQQPFSDSSNDESKFTFELQDGKYNIRNLDEYLVYNLNIILTEDNSNIDLTKNGSEIQWHLECAGNGYYYIRNTYDNKKINIGPFNCFKLIGQEEPICLIGRSVIFTPSVGSSGSKTSRIAGPWRLVCQ